MEIRLRTDQQSQKANTKQTKKGRTLGTRLPLNCLNYMIWKPGTLSLVEDCDLPQENQVGVVTFLGSDADPFVFTRVYKWLAKLDFITSVFFLHLTKSSLLKRNT